MRIMLPALMGCVAGTLAGLSTKLFGSNEPVFPNCESIAPFQSRMGPARREMESVTDGGEVRVSFQLKSEFVGIRFSVSEGKTLPVSPPPKSFFFEWCQKGMKWDWWNWLHRREQIPPSVKMKWEFQSVAWANC